MNERDVILKIINDGVRGYVDRIKRDPALVEWIEENSTADTDQFRVKVYSAISGESNVCKYGKYKKLESVTNGWRCCGTASKCECSREQLSARSKELQRNMTVAQREEITKKRMETSMKNNGYAHNFNNPAIQQAAIKKAAENSKLARKKFIPTGKP